MAKCAKSRRFTLLRQLRRRQAARTSIGMESLEPRAMLATLYWDPNGATPGVGGSGTWDLSTANWTTDPSGSSPTIAWTNNAADVAVFNTTPDSSGSVPASTVTIGSGIAVSQATFSSGAYTLQGGSLSVPSGLTIGVDAGGSATWAGAFSGAGSLVKTGPGTLAVSSGNTGLSSGARLEGGTLVVANNAALGTGMVQMAGGSLQASGARTLANTIQAVAGTTSTLVSPSGSNLTLNGSITGSGTLQKTGAYSVYLGGDNSAFAGTFIHQASNLYFNTPSAGSALAAWAINGGGQLGMNFSGNAVVQLGSLSGTSGWIHGGNTKTGTKTIEVGALGTSATYAGRFIDYDAVNGGSQVALKKIGSGTLTLTAGSSPYVGGSRIEAGTIIVGSDTALGSGTIQLAGGILQASGNRSLANAIQAVAGTTSTIVSPSGSNLTLNGSITGSGTLQKTGGYSVFLGGDNSAFAGTFVHQASNLYFNTPFAGSALAAWVINGGGQLGMNFSGNAVVQLGSLAGTSGVIHGGYGKTGTKTIEVGALGTSTTYAGRFIDFDAVNGGSQIAVRKIGSGTFTLSAASTHSGATEVLSGVLTVTGSLAASNVLTSNGGAFKGVAAASQLSVNGLASGVSFDLWVTWTPASGRSASVPYQVVDGGTVVDTVLVNQTQAPVGKVINGTAFQKLGTYAPSGTALSVRILSQPSGTTDSGAVVSETSATPPPHLFYRLEGLSFSVGETSSPITSSSVAPTYAGWMDAGSWTTAVTRGAGGPFTIAGRNGSPDQVFTFPDGCSIGYAAEFMNARGNSLASLGVTPDQRIVVFEDWTDADMDDDYWLPYVAEGTPTVNLDTDSDNDGSISHAVDDPIEMSAPGRLVAVREHARDPLAAVQIDPIGLSTWVSGNIMATLSASNNIRVYADAAGTQMLFPAGSTSRTWDAATEALPTTVYVAGLTPGSASLTWTVVVDGHAINDSVAFTVVTLDLDVDSNNDGEIDPDNGLAGKDDPIEDHTNLPGVIVPVGGEWVPLIVTVPEFQTATLAFDATAAERVRVYSPAGVVALDVTHLSTTVEGGTAQTFWIEAFAPSASMADITLTLTLTLDDSTGSGSAGSGSTGSAPTDTIRATAVALTAQSNGIVSADDGRLWVYAVVSDPTRSSGDSPAVTFELLGADGSTTGITGSATVVDSFAYTVLNLPDRLLHIDPANPAASAYRVRARYRSLTTDSDETAVVPGLAKNIQAVANVAFTAKPGFSFNITDANVPFLRDFAGVGRVTVTATVRDRLGNLVADGTPVIWGTVDDGFNPDDVLDSGTETVNGIASFAIAADRISPVARLSVTADQTAITGFLSGGELRVTLELLDTSNDPANDRIIDLDERWWFATRSETIRIRATVRRQDGSPVGPGVPVKFHDTKRLLDDVTVATDDAGKAVADMFVPNDRASWSILGRNVVTASAAGYSAQEATRIIGRSILPPVELEFSAAFLAGDQTNDGTLELADPTALSDVTAVVNAPFAATSTITLRNLTPGEPYRLEVPANAPVQLRLAGATPAAQVRFTAPPDNGETGSTFQIFVESKGGMTGTSVEVVKPLLYLESSWWNWFEDPVGYSVKGDTAGTIIVGPASAAARIGQITQSIVGGALFGAGGLDASLAGDIGLSMITGIGVAADVRDLGKSLLQLVPVDLGLGPFDWREAAIAGFGILTEVLPAADAIVDVYRSMYKIAKQVPIVMPVFLSIEPLFTRAIRSLFDFRPAAASGSLTAAGDSTTLAIRASSASFGADDIFRWLEGVPGIGKTNARRLLAHTEIGKVLKNDEVFRGKYAEMVRVSGSKFGDDLETIFDAFGKDALVRMVMHGTANVEDFGAGFNAMATALRRHSAGGTWQNTALLDSLKANPEDAANIFTDIGTTSRRVQEANIRFGKGIAGESDVSQAIALVIGRASGSTGHSFVRNIDELRNFSDDLKTLTDVGRTADQMRSAAELIRRFRSERVIVQSQAGRLFEVQEVAAALRANPDTVISFNKLTPGAATDIDLELPGKAIELKYTLGSVKEKDIITKFFKYRATVGPGKPLELRSLDSEASMQAFVEAAFKKYLDMPDIANWPKWLTRLTTDPGTLRQVKNAISYSQAGSTRYNFFAAAG